MAANTDTTVLISQTPVHESDTFLVANGQKNPPSKEQADNASPLVAHSKADLEIEKLKEELLALRQGRRWTGSLRPVVLGLIVSLSTGALGYLFGDSLKARSRAEMRKATMDRYFAVDNAIPGKRRQMLSFIERYLASDDPELLAWVRRENAVVDGHLLNLKTQVATFESELSSIRTQLGRAQGRLQETEAQLDTAEKDVRIGQSKRRQLERERDHALRERDSMRAAKQEIESKVEHLTVQAAPAAPTDTYAPPPSDPRSSW